MREIKFRAWNEWADRKEMVYFKVDEPKAIENTAWNAEIMQYTGLKDKNGKEIYEGDIIKYSHKAVGEIKRVVSYKYGMYGIEGKMKETHIPFANILQSEYEVIGNIYENPELLEGN